jgi:hypothetical protein
MPLARLPRPQTDTSAQQRMLMFGKCVWPEQQRAGLWPVRPQCVLQRRSVLSAGSLTTLRCVCCSFADAETAAS